MLCPAQIIQSLRQFLTGRGFLEVETPVLWSKAGGALATPFKTVSRALGADTPLTMRVAPELFLKVGSGCALAVSEYLVV